MWELGLIILVALILLGPRQLTETARVLGKLYREVTKLTSDLRSSIDLDSITSTTSSPPHVEPDPARTEPLREPKDDMDLLASPGERSGPDFYAELLESSKEDDEAETGQDANPTEENAGESGEESEPGQDRAESKDRRDD